MLFFEIIRRLNAAEARLEALEETLRGPVAGETEEEGEKTPVYRLDDRKMQEGISNLMGYDPFGKKRDGAG